MQKMAYEEAIHGYSNAGLVAQIELISEQIGMLDDRQNQQATKLRAALIKRLRGQRLALKNELWLRWDGR